MELPDPQQLPYCGREGDNRQLLSFHWYNARWTDSGRDELTTYHNYSSGWYVEIPESWDERVTVQTVQRSSRARGAR